MNWYGYVKGVVTVNKRIDWYYQEVYKMENEWNKLIGTDKLYLKNKYGVATKEDYIKYLADCKSKVKVKKDDK